ncbi:hypothetical protein N7510_006760 [Penicillium lagena]|uniref:uncharacterized protein n=1 Tax=Penicillium lagena TaxID=94218 RepID=UPI00253F66BE|nr:uncharacterized protein N7510_006760 [Penicillium lagena]KAJ5610041.1 hypothetical protein N7510_006760 [Penicillium lagena]
MPHAHHANLHHPNQREVVPVHRLPLLMSSSDSTSPALFARAPQPSSTSDCAKGSNCTKPESELTTTVLPVVLGAGVPLLCAAIVLYLLHRRSVRKLKREDINDKYKSLDFGLDPVASSQGRRRPGPQGPMPPMAHSKGLSLDIMHPYLLPPGIHGSTDSLHSLSRTVTGDDDKYRPATIFTQDNGSVRSFPRTPRDDGSSMMGSTHRLPVEEPKSALLRNAQRMSRSSPPLYNNPSAEPRSGGSPPRPEYHEPTPGVAPYPLDHDELNLAIGSTAAATAYEEEKESKSHDHAEELHLPPLPTPTIHVETEAELHGAESNSTLHEERLNFPLPEPVPSPRDSELSEHVQASTTQLPRISLPSSDVTSDYGDDHRQSEFTIPAVNISDVEEKHHDATPLPEVPEESAQSLDLDLAYDNRRDTRRLTMGLRPLPPDDPSENPEQRANRIRSFYKEYFDDSKAGGRETQYYEDYDEEYWEGDGFVYDPVTGEYFDAAHPYGSGGGRHMASSSVGFGGYAPGPRAFSSASGRLPGARGPPRKPMPIPSPLQNLPTPHALKDDAFMHGIEFAPGKNFRDQREGRPETPTGGLRPFSPAIRAHTPLASPFEELAPMPSPHALRKSGTYTNLDFAPPPRFKNQDTGSDAGSIRSARTGISTAHMNNIRMGAYRVSRLPPEVVGTRDDLMTSLKPTWDMSR